jgi:Carboxypeptidase regulatory-like domain
MLVRDWVTALHREGTSTVCALFVKMNAMRHLPVVDRRKSCILAIVRGVFVLGVVLLLTRLCGACTCDSSARQPFCAVQPIMSESLESAVFVGTVLSTITDETKRTREVHLEQVERFQGSGIDNEMVVFTGMGDGDCGVPFEAGATYLVIAHRRPNGSWGTSICSRTGRLDHPESSPEVKALRAWRDNQPIHGWIYGWVSNTATAFHAGDPEPLSGVVVRFRSGHNIREIRTDAQGSFSIEGLTPMKYKVQVDFPGWQLVSRDHFALRHAPNVDLTASRCGRLDLRMEPLR